MRYCVAILLLLLISNNFSTALAALPQDSAAAIIKGTVKSGEGKPIDGANVVIKGTIDGATTDSSGYFEFETSKFGSRVLLVTAIEFGDKEFDIDIIPGQVIIKNVTITKGEYKTDEILVTASSFTSGQNSRVTITPLEIVQISGSQADLYRAITTFPGSNQVDEGSRIAVRGGEPNEVLTMLDGATMYKPFIFDDTYNTSTFSTINPWEMKGINFSSGGFSAKYGNVLSAVLDLQTYDFPNSSGAFLWAGLTGVNLSGQYVSSNRKFGATIDGGVSVIRPYFLFNGITTDYSPDPSANTLGGTLTFKTSASGLLKIYANYNDDKIGIRSISPSYNGYFNGSTNNFFSNIKYSFAPSSISLLNTSISINSIKTKNKYGVLDNTTTENYAKLRSDFGIPLSTQINFDAGAELEYSENKASGTYPVYFYNLNPDALSYKLNAMQHTSRIGGYAEVSSRMIKNFLLQTGIRSDYYTLSGKSIIDPRLSMVYRLSQTLFLKGAAGIYRQDPSLQYYSQMNTTGLSPEKAVHYILGFEFNSENDYILRVESYYKKYSNLITYNPLNYGISTDGEGTAKGIDVFLKARYKSAINGWISYSAVDSKRSASPVSGEFPADYDITHTLSVVANFRFTSELTLGLTYRYATGKPYTPITGSIPDTTQNVYIPLYAGYNSGRFPEYHRFDASIQYIFRLFNRIAVGVISVMNIFNNKNIYEYTYNRDYSQRRTVYTNSVREVYLGFGFYL